jgi:hypothetical protein
MIMIMIMIMIIIIISISISIITFKEMQAINNLDFKIAILNTKEFLGSLGIIVD